MSAFFRSSSSRPGVLKMECLDEAEKEVDRRVVGWVMGEIRSLSSVAMGSELAAVGRAVLVL